MVAIVSRASKGSPLDNAELDANFANLNNGKVEANSSAVIAALGFTPYNATNPSGYLDQAGVRASVSASGSLTYNSTTGVFGVTIPVTSVAGKTGAVTLNTSDVSEGTNQYFTQARARTSISVSGSLAYNSSTGVISFTDAVTSVAGRTGAITLSTTDVSEGVNEYFTTARARTSISVSGDLTYNSSTGVLGVNVPVTSVFGRTGAVVLQSGDVTGALGFTPAPNASPVFTGASTFANGTVAFPGIRFTTENNTGFYRSGTNQISVATNGVLAATFAANGDFTAAGNVTAFSDEILKEDWSSLPPDFVERLAQVKSGTYTRKDTGDRQVGVSAQSLRDASPEGVVEGKYLSVAYGNVALAACVQLAQRVLDLEQKLAITNQNIAEVRGQ